VTEISPFDRDSVLKSGRQEGQGTETETYTCEDSFFYQHVASNLVQLPVTFGGEQGENPRTYVVRLRCQ
jgi:hypothetical protein